MPSTLEVLSREWDAANTYSVNDFEVKDFQEV